MDMQYLLIGVLIMAVTTYVIRAVPMVLFRKKIENPRIKSFLYYVPYTVLAAMTFPAIFSSTESTLTSAAGCLAAVILAYYNRGLLVVALGASAVAFLASFI